MRAAIFVVLGLATTASAEPAYRTEVHLVEPTHLEPFATVNTHTFYINRCTGGCTVTNGTTDNRNDRSDIAGGTGQIAAFNQSQAVWDGMMSCLRDTYSRFNIVITDIDPGTMPHLEVMVAGLAGQLNSQLGGNVGGIADVACSGVGSCDNFIPNALSFTFANASFYHDDPLELCSTTAQEIAHTWALDHVVDKTDPMTYNSFSGMRNYKDNQPCGSDCSGGKSPFPFQATCTGTPDNLATHVCFNGSATQNEVQVITGLFGSSGPKPTVKITSPAANSAVQNMFEVDVDCTASDGVAMVQASIDGTGAGTKTAAPFKFTAPSLTNGPHHVVAFCSATGGGQASVEIDVTQGTPCDTAADCKSTEICYRGACVAGPNSSGGLGATCTNNSDCVGGSCSSDGTEQHCTLPCEVGAGQCPSGFGCLAAGQSGVCWPGAEDGDGGPCSGGAGSGSAAMFGLVFAAFVVIRRRR